MRWLGRQGLVVCDVVALVHEGEYHIRHSSRMGLRRPLGGPRGQLGRGYRRLPGLGDGGGQRDLCDRRHVVRWGVEQ